MTLTKEFPTQNPTISSQNPVSVRNPAVSPSGTLVAQVTLTALAQDKTAIANQLGAGEYLVISSITVSGNPPSGAKVPALQVSYPYYGANGPDSFTVSGTTSQGTDVSNDFNVTQSCQFTASGEGAVSAGVVGGVYTGAWSYEAVISIYRV